MFVLILFFVASRAESEHRDKDERHFNVAEDAKSCRRRLSK